MRHRPPRRFPIFAVLAVLAVASLAPQRGFAQGQPTSPRQFFGHDIGADYVLPNYTQFAAYWQKVASESPRARLDTIGLTAEGRPQLSLIVSSPENMKRLARYQEIAKRLAVAEGLDDAGARALAAEGKAVVWIDGGLHGTEVLGANQLIETSWQFVSMSDPETLRILDDVIIVFVHANPDGMELVANWYMQEEDPRRRNTSIPRLYQKYIGHDDNRDFYISNQPETTNMNRRLYLEWYPQIVYNHHQTGPDGAVMFAPPFRDPANYNFHPSIITGIDLVGAALHGRFVAEHKPGVVSRSLSSYSTWWNGGLRTMAYFHNMIGILTETIGSPTPMTTPFIPDRLLRNADQVLPLAPNREWHFRQSIDYSVTANRAVLDLAQRYREFFLYNIYAMGRDQIAWASTDSWVTTPGILAGVKEQIAADPAASRESRGSEREAPASAKYASAFARWENRLPRGYVIPADQPDFLTATKFVGALQKAGVVVHRANAPFSVGATSYPKGSFVVKTAQAFRPHVLDMFEPQEHPNDFRYPGAAPTRPYDNAGWTLAMQMGVKFDRIRDAFDGPFERLDPLNDRVAPAAGTVASARGWVLSPKQNDAFHAVGRLWKARADVYRLERAVTAGGRTFSAGSFYVPANDRSRPVVLRSAQDLGLDFEAAGNLAGRTVLLKPARIGLWDTYGGSMASGHARWLLEQFELPFEVVFPSQFDAGDLKAKYDVLVFYQNAIPEQGGRAGRGTVTDTTLVPSEFRPRLGALTREKTLPALRAFLEAEGRIVAVGPSSLNLAGWLELPVTNHLTERTPSGPTARPLPAEKFFVPGSLLEVAYDTTALAARGQDARGIVFFDNSATFRLLPEASQRGLKPVAWYENGTPLRSGWAWGQNYLDGGVAAVVAPYGKGTVYLYGPEVTFRAQPHGTFKLLFNAIVGK